MHAVLEASIVTSLNLQEPMHSFFLLLVRELEVSGLIMSSVLGLKLDWLTVLPILLEATIAFILKMLA